MLSTMDDWLRNDDGLTASKLKAKSLEWCTNFPNVAYLINKAQKVWFPSLEYQVKRFLCSPFNPLITLLSNHWTPGKLVNKCDVSYEWYCNIYTDCGKFHVMPLLSIGRNECQRYSYRLNHCLHKEKVCIMLAYLYCHIYILFVVVFTLVERHNLVAICFFVCSQWWVVAD